MTGPARARWPLLVGALALATHVGALRNGFALDDVPLVADNPAIRSLAGASAAFVSPYWNVPGERYGLYRPLTIVSLAVNRALTAPGPAGFHGGNLLLHAAAAALAWLTLRRVCTHYGAALAAAGLFAVLPIHTEAVANIAGRAELLAAVLVLCAWLAHRRARDTGRSAVLPAVLYLGALLSKESAVLAPALFACDDALGEQRPLASRYAPYAGALAVAAVLRLVALGPHLSAESAIPLDNPAAAAGAGARVLTALWVQARLLFLCVWPKTLVCDYSFDAIPVVRDWLEPRALGGLAVFGALLAHAIAAWRRSRPVSIAAAGWVVFYLPSSNLMFATGTIMAERLAYLPSLGVCFLAGHLLAALGSRPGRGRLAVAATVLLVTAMAARSVARVPAWKDNLTLATTDVVSQPRSAKLQAGAGIFLAANGRAADAEDHFRRALEIYPDYAQIHYDLGVLLARRGAPAEAEEHLRRAIALAPSNLQPYEALAALLDRAGRRDEAASVRAEAPR
jgi:tetratricopeptide (TPR) repeat protein